MRGRTLAWRDPESLCPGVPRDVSVRTGSAQLPSSQWHKTASSATLARMNKDEIRRQEGISELIQSEENYVNDLGLVVRVRRLRRRQPCGAHRRRHRRSQLTSVAVGADVDPRSRASLSCS